MARAPNYELAELDYINGMKYKDIAEKYSVTINTVKSWKTRYQWSRDKKGVHTKTEKVCAQNKKSANKKEAIAEDVKQVIENPDLTDKQRLFCLYYVRCFNATKAYQKAYGVDYLTANAHGFKLLSNVVIRTEIQRLKQNRLNREMLDESDIFQKYMDIAFADINDFAKINGFCVEARDKIDGTIVSEVSGTANGVKIKLNDRMKALDWIAAHMDLATEKQKAEIEVLKSKVSHAEESTENQIGKFLDALKGAVTNEPE